MLKVLPILIAVVAADAFGLSYTGYNKYLIDEFQSLNKDVSFSRHRPGANVTELLCCTGDTISFVMQDYIERSEKGCFPAYEEANRNKSDDFSDVPEVVICVTECVLSKLHMTDRNGKLDREKLFKFYEVFEVEEIKWKKDALAGYVDACLTKVASTPKATDKQCSRAALDFDVCMASKFLEGCPADLRIDSEMCNWYRKTVADYQF